MADVVHLPYSFVQKTTGRIRFFQEISHVFVLSFGIIVAKMMSKWYTTNRYFALEDCNGL